MSKSTSKKSASKSAARAGAGEKSSSSAAGKRKPRADKSSVAASDPSPARTERAAPPSMPVAPGAKPNKPRGKQPVDLGQALIHAFETSERIHQYLLEHLDPSLWALEAPVGKGRVIRGVFAHIHNVRCLWLERRGEEFEAPAKVDRASVTQDELRDALRASSAAVVGLIRTAIDAGGHVPDFKPDVVGFVSYAIAHEAHHRGQICMLARILGKPLPQAQGYELWNWRKRAEEALELRSPPAPAS